jgi:hypothetical protein
MTLLSTERSIAKAVPSLGADLLNRSSFSCRRKADDLLHWAFVTGREKIRVKARVVGELSIFFALAACEEFQPRPTTSR